MSSRSTIAADIIAKILTGGSDTTAANTRIVLNELLNQSVNLLDDANVAGGYMAIDDNLMVDVSFIKKLTPTGEFLRDDGTWGNSLSGDTLNQVLTTGNATLGKNIVISQDDVIQMGPGTAGITNKSSLASNNNIFLYTDPAYTATFLAIMDGANNWTDQTSNGKFSIGTNNVNITLDESAGTSVLNTGSNGFTINGATTINGSTNINGLATLGTGTYSLIYLNNAQSGSQLQIQNLTSGYNEIDFVLGTTGSASQLVTSAPIWTTNVSWRFDTSAQSNIYVNNGGLGLGLYGRNDTTGNYGITIADNGIVKFGANTLSTVPYFDASNNLVSSAVTPTELGYVSGVTSSIQSQFSDTNITGKLLTGYVSGSGTVSSSDSILTAIQKLNGNISLVAGAIVFKGLWNATTNSPALASGVGTTGWMYKVSVAGTTTLDGISQWNVGDQLFFDGTVWDKIDGISTEVLSVNGLVGAVPLTGTSNRITVSAANIFDISASYVGQSSITTLGTIGSGTWNGSVIDPAYGGTGIANNAASTLTISGNFASTFNVTASTNITLPTSGTVFSDKTTSITSAQLLGALTNPTGTGVAVFGTSPTFTTSITAPLIYGGTAVGSTLSLQGTSGNGTSTVAAINFLVGNNGATTAAKIYNDGTINLGNATNTSQRLVRIGQDTAFADFGSRVSGTGNFAIYACVTPSASNWAFSSDGSTLTAINNPSFTAIRVNNNNLIAVNTSDITFSPTSVGSGAITNFTFTAANHTGQTASTPIPKALYTLGSTQWATGALAATQPFFSITQPTISFVGSSTATLTATLSIAGAPNSGTNAIQTTAVGLLVQSAAVNGTGTVGTSYGAYINAQTGATTNIALGINGNMTLDLSGASITGTAGNLLINANAGNLQLRAGAVTYLTVSSNTLTLRDGVNFVFDTSTGTKIGFATNQKLAFYGSTPIVQPTGDVVTALQNLGLVASATLGAITGTTTNDNAAAGKVGEYVESVIATGSAVSLTTATTANVTSISLTAGDWDIEILGYFKASGASASDFQLGLSTTSATMDTTAGRFNNNPTVVTGLSGDLSSVVPRYRLSLSGTTTVYFTAQSTFTLGTVSVYGIISARRVR